MKRVFIAIPISEEIKATLVPLLNELDGLDAGFKIVKPENLHFTVKFLDEVNDQQLEEIKRRLSPFIFSPFFINLNKIGYFAIADLIKVLWIGAEDKNLVKLIEQVQALFKDIREEECHKIVPHLTLARMKFKQNQDLLKQFIIKHQHDSFGRMEINKFVLYESILTPNGPIYHKLYTFG
ncbi:RNA 2',3'-cyclic phosphodiesterase [Candidatus Woesearchaeota archaeon CG_4_10_14_0_2_um_filter_33_13]|nr:MAG: RNA 2',3'-cyclic phosphodiesterase [Candidatus Woesearchaeota archaeon CG_4_10_14_0_2_um_filter_33_13]